MNDIKKIIKFLRLIEKLKTVERFNKTSNLSRNESDAEHIWHLVMMGYLLADQKPQLNKMKLIELALVHDLIEVYSGDVNLWDDKKKSEEQKKSSEKRAAKKLFAKLPKIQGKKLSKIWNEYEERETPEAVFVYALDKLQPFLQRLTSRDNGWKEKMVDLKRLKDIRPQEIKNEPFLSKIWDDFIQEAKKKDMLFKSWK